MSFREREEIAAKLEKAKKELCKNPSPAQIGFVEGLERCLAVIDDAWKEALRVSKFCPLRAEGYHKAVSWSLEGAP